MDGEGGEGRRSWAQGSDRPFRKWAPSCRLASRCSVSSIRGAGLPPAARARLPHPSSQAVLQPCFQLLFFLFRARTNGSSVWCKPLPLRSYLRSGEWHSARSSLPGLKATFSPQAIVSTVSVTSTPVVAPSPLLMCCAIDKTLNSWICCC